MYFMEVFYIILGIVCNIYIYIYIEIEEVWVNFNGIYNMFLLGNNVIDI